MLSAAGKILVWILIDCLTSLAEEILPESQSIKRHCRHNFLHTPNSREMQHGDLYMAFIDLTKAFVLVDRPTLWKVLVRIGCPGKYIGMIRLLHDNKSASVIVDVKSTSSFAVKTGIKQG